MLLQTADTYSPAIGSIELTTLSRSSETSSTRITLNESVSFLAYESNHKKEYAGFEQKRPLSLKLKQRTQKIPTRETPTRRPVALVLQHVQTAALGHRLNLPD